ncbi:MAG TPA: transglycosylase SLT domain-containing protein [Pseudonocardiaceae bacterium]|nr:transglycosylase SLT domain-containing protein [Pseudonocardiaceae bacterium]
MLAVALAGGGLALAAGTPANASPAMGTSASPAVRACGLGAAQARPARMILACADGDMVASQLRWQSWNAQEASATATVTWQANTARRGDTSADITLSDPVLEADGETLFTTLTMHVTGTTPVGFKRDLSFNETPAAASQAAPGASKAVPSIQPAASSGTLNTAAIGGYWELAGGPSSVAETAEAITGAESSFLPGIIQAGQPYSTTGWGLWQITPGNSVPAYGEDYQLLDPWNNAEAAVAKFDAAGGFSPWTTFDDGAYESFLGDTSTPNTNLADPGQYVSINGAPAGTHNSSGPGSTFGPTIPGGGAPAPGFAFKAVFQANNDLLAGDSSSGSNFTTTLGMMPGTSPSVTTLADGTFEAAFEANNDNLALSHLGGGTLSTHEGMLQGTSPAIAALPGGGWIAAFQANTNHLALFDSNQHVTDTHLGMAPGTNPAIAVQSDGTYRVVFEANNDLLAGYNSSGTNFTTTAGMKAGTSPAITTLPGDQDEVAIQANTGKLATLHFGSGFTVNATDLGMDPTSSPAVAAQSDGSFRVVFEANNDLLAGYSSGGTNFTATAGMKAGTSPAITAEPGGEYEVAIEANTDKLATLHFGNGYTVNGTDLGMDDTTSPAITY